VTFLSDAIGAESLPAYEASIHLNYPLIGNAVLEVDEFLAAIQRAAAPAQVVQVGDTVYGSGRGKIGRVKEIVPADGQVAAYLVVPRGMVFDKDTFIPLDAVAHRVQDRVYINVPKLVIGKLPWDERPPSESARSKLGAPVNEVEAMYRSHAPSGTPPTTR
jgi:hypothetical protein